MPTIMGHAFTADWEGKPPQITAQESAIWQSFREKNKDIMLRIFFNVKVGGGITPPPDVDPETALLWTTSTMLRIDAIVETETAVWIVELRPRLTKSILGSLHIYLALWNASPKIDKPAIAVAVVNLGSPIIEGFCALNNYKVIIV